MTEAEFLEVVRRDPANAALLDGLPALGLRDVWVVSGCLFQAAWNAASGLPAGHGVADYDVFYCDDRDVSWEAEDAAIAAAAAAFAGLGVEVQVRNQARVHLWYPEKFGAPYAPITQSTEAIDRFLAACCMVGLQPDGRGGARLYAPRGLEDVARMVVRPNPSPNYRAEAYRAKAARWKARWPRLRVQPA